MENTKYSTGSNALGYWLEVTSSTTSYVWNVDAIYRIASNYTVLNSSANGVRPAIEVSKSKISY